jgi:hypothetical protein
MRTTRAPVLNWLLTAAILLIALGGLLFTAFTARLPDLDCRQNQTDILQAIDAQSPLTQAIRPAADGFVSLTLSPHYTPPAEGSSHSITLRLLDDSFPTRTLFESTRPLDRLRRGKLDLHFPAQARSTGRNYRLEISTDAPPGVLYLAASAANRYPHGDLLDGLGQPLTKDLAFTAYYRPSLPAWLNLIVRAFPVAAGWLGLSLIFILAGLACHFVLQLALPQTLSFLLAQSLGLGLALLIIIGYTQSILGFPFSPASLRTCALLLLAAVVLRAWHIRRRQLSSWQLPRPRREDAVLLLLLIFSFLSRAIQTIPLQPVPLWVDGFNHHLKLAYLAETGFLPLHINYPYGYHLLSAFAHLTTRLNLPASAFHAGFWISALAAPAAWPLARRLFARPGPALLAAVLYGFFAPFPAYLVTWSRFPFLLGLTLLPLAIAAALDWLESPHALPFSRELTLALPPALLGTALALSHYGATVHWAAFILAWLLRSRFDADSSHHFKLRLRRLAGLALPVGAVLVILVFSLMQRGLWQSALSANAAADQTLDLRHFLHLTTQAGGWLVWALAAVGLLAALLWKDHRKLALTILLWLAILFLLDIAQLKLLGTAVSSLANFVLAISLPLSWLAATALDGAVQFLKTSLPAAKFPAWLPAAFLLILLLIGFTSISGIINPVTILFTDQDQQAVTWIRQQTAPDAVFLIDTFLWGTTFSPANGGGWLTALTGRPAIYPRTADQQADMQAFLEAHPPAYVYAAHGRPLEDIPFFQNAKPVFQTPQVTIYALP